MGAELERMEADAQAIGNLIAQTLHEKHEGKVRFCLVLTNVGDEGWFTYVSNVERTSMLALLKEAIEKVSKEA